MYRTILLFAVIIVASVGAVLVFPGPQIASAWANDNAYYWCGLTVNDSSGHGLPNLAVHLPSNQDIAYATDGNGYVKIWNTGFTSGCPGGKGPGITALVTYHNTQYAKYLLADQNVTLEVV